MRHTAAILAAFLALAGCRTGNNYPGSEGPRYAGSAPSASPAGMRGDTVRVASFNIEYALRVDSAVAVMRSEPGLRDADVILLQEMDEAGTRRVAEAFGMHYVYYPGTFRRATRRDFGNAVLSRGPILEDRKILLPHVGIFGRTQRVATAATVMVRGVPVRVYSTHLGTMVNATPAARRRQLRTVLADAARYPRVIVGGDMNSHGVGRVAREMGYAWPTEHGPRTTRFGRWDHIVLKGLASPGSAAAGTVLDVRGTSDHRAVWAVAVLR